MKKDLRIRHVLSYSLKFNLTMKLTVLLLLVSIFSIQANTYSQNAKITCHLENVKITNVFEKIEKDTEFKFLYNHNEINANRIVSVVANKEPLVNILQNLFSTTSISFTIRNKQIILKKEVNEYHNLLDNAKHTKIENSENQEFTLNGTITDSNGEPLPGASIVEKGTTNGAQSDFDGNFSLTLTNKDAILIISYIGFSTKEIAVANQTVINVSLEESTAGLDEVVVVGYGTQKKKDLTGAIATVNSDDFAPGANINASQLLNGVAAGVNVSQASSSPGGGTKIQIRGSGSINSSNDVLFVVDGLPGVDPQSLSPEDIESIQVLKDASSSSIYGTRAANGVVLITTKRGKAGKTTLSYSAYTGFQNSNDRTDVLGASDYIDLVNFRNPGNPIYSEQDKAAIGEGTNWEDQLFTGAVVQNHQVTMSGGNEKGNYYLGLNYFNQDGIVKTSGYKKYNVRLNMQTRPIEKLLISANINFTQEGIKEIFTTSRTSNLAGPLNSAVHNDPTLPSGLDENGQYYLNPVISLDNPSALLNGITDNSSRHNFYGALTTEYEVIKNLKATVRLGAEINNRRDDLYKDTQTDLGRLTGGDAEIDHVEFSHWLTEYLLSYKNSFNNDHDFSIMAGATFEEFSTRRFSARGTGFLSDLTGTDLIGSGNGESGDDINSAKLKNTLNGFLGRVTYGYKNRYLLTASLRVDGSSRFSENNKYGYFPSGSIGWNISQEPFLENSNWVNNLKLRLGYGELGNQGIGNFATRQTLRAGGNSIFGGSVAQGVIPSRLPNPDLKWETTSETNFGLDFDLFNSRISGNLDYFNRKTADQLFLKPLPSVVGFSEVLTNIGEVVNKGLEIGLRTKNIVGAFSWSSNINLAFLNNEVTQLPEFSQTLLTGNVASFINNYAVVQEGSPLRSFYGFDIEGVIQEGEDINNIPTPDVNGYGPGMPKFVDQNGDGEINDLDRTVLGDPFPDFTFGIGNSFKYKRLSLDVFINGVMGIETLDGNIYESIYPTNSRRNSISKFYHNRWTPNNPTNDYSSLENPSLYGGSKVVNSWTVVDASFFRLKNITLGYKIPTDKLRSISSLSVYISADNLATITSSDFEGFDPDSNAANRDDAAGDSGNVIKVQFNSYPIARTFRLGLNVKF